MSFWINRCGIFCFDRVHLSHVSTKSRTAATTEAFSFVKPGSDYLLHCTEGKVYIPARTAYVRERSLENMPMEMERTWKAYIMENIIEQYYYDEPDFQAPYCLKLLKVCLRCSKYHYNHFGISNSAISIVIIGYCKRAQLYFHDISERACNMAKREEQWNKNERLNKNLFEATSCSKFSMHLP